MRYPHYEPALRVMLLVVGLAVPGCVPDGPTGPEAQSPAPETPDRGSLTVEVSTTGIETPDSLAVSLDAEPAQRLPSSGSFTWPDVTPGEHLVRVADLPDNCAAEGENPRSVSVASGGSEITLFAIACSSTLAEIRVRVATTGEYRDKNGYRVEVKGDDVSLRRDVDADADVTFPGLPADDYRVELRDVDKKCQVDDDKLELTVNAGERVDVEFSVTCDD